MAVNLDDHADTKTSQKKTIRSDPIMNSLLTKTPAEVFQWVDTNVTDMASAKELLKRLAAATAWLLKQ